MRRVPFFFAVEIGSCNVGSWRPVTMSDSETEANGKCQACHGTGTVAGARPVRSGPFLLNPRLLPASRVSSHFRGTKVACFNDPCVGCPASSSSQILRGYL
jgi:hypothetical protein